MHFLYDYYTTGFRAVPWGFLTDILVGEVNTLREESPLNNPTNLLSLRVVSVHNDRVFSDKFCDLFPEGIIQLSILNTFPDTQSRLLFIHLVVSQGLLLPSL